MFTQISIDMISAEEGKQTIEISVVTAGRSLPANLLLKGEFDLPEKVSYPFDHSCFDKLLPVIQEVLEDAESYLGFSSSFPECFSVNKPLESEFAMISMT